MLRVIERSYAAYHRKQRDAVLAMAEDLVRGFSVEPSNINTPIINPPFPRLGAKPSRSTYAGFGPASVPIRSWLGPAWTRSGFFLAGGQGGWRLGAQAQLFRFWAKMLTWWVRGWVWGPKAP